MVVADRQSPNERGTVGERKRDIGERKRYSGRTKEGQRENERGTLGVTDGFVNSTNYSDYLIADVTTGHLLKSHLPLVNPSAR